MFRAWNPPSLGSRACTQAALGLAAREQAQTLPRRPQTTHGPQASLADEVTEGRTLGHSVAGLPVSSTLTRSSPPAARPFVLTSPKTYQATHHIRPH